MAKEITGQIKLQIPAGQANPAPPVGPALGQQGVNIMAFCKELYYFLTVIVSIIFLSLFLIYN